MKSGIQFGLRWVLMTTLGVPGTWAHAQDDSVNKLAEIQQQMLSTQVVRGTFAQEKTFTIMTRPLKSSGTFALHQDKGIWWHSAQPIPSDMIINSAGLVQRNARGDITRMDARQQPAMQIISSVIRSLFSADFAVLEKQFHIKTQQKGGGWEAELTPRVENIGQFAKQILLQGKQSVERIEIQEAGGDKTVISFSAVSGADTLQESEANAFSW